VSPGRDLSLAHLVVLVCLGIFLVVIVFILGLIVFPVVAATVAAYFAYQHGQMKKLRVNLPDPKQTVFSSVLPQPIPVLVPRNDPNKFAEQLHDKVLAYVEKDTGRYSCKALSDTFTEVITQLYGDESFHNPPEPPETKDLISRATYQDKLEAWQKKTADSTAYDLFLEVASGAYMEMREYFPPLAFLETKPSSITSSMMISMEPNQVTSLGAWFFQQAVLDNRLFEKLRDQILENDIAIETAKGKPTFDTIFAGTPLAAFSAVNVPFDIPDSRMMEHCVIVAGSGHGKTQTLGAMIARFLEQDEPPALVVLDSTGSLVKKIQQLALFNDRLNDRIVIIDPEHEPSPSLNMFDISNPRMDGYSRSVRESVETEIVALFNYVFTSAQNDLTSRQGTVFSYVVRLVLSMPNATIHTLRQVLEEEPKGGYQNSRYRPYIDRLDPTAQDFFKNQYFELKGFREQIAQRVYGLVQIPAFERMFANKNKVDFYDELQNKGSIILVNTSERLLKENGSPLFGRYIIARTLAAAFERASISEQTRRPTFLIVDEAAPYFDDTFEKILTRVRQFKLGVCLAFQHMEQASEKLRSAIASNTSVKMAGGLGYTDSRWLARDMETTPEFLKAQRRDSADSPQWTQLACYVRNFTPQAVSLTVPFYLLEKMPQMAPAEHRALVERNRARVSSTSLDIDSAPLPQPPRATTLSAQSPPLAAANAPPPPRPQEDTQEAASEWQ